jgi:putative transposase
MNPIELQLQQIKKDELAAEIFDSELEVAYALIHGVEVKGERGNYRTQYVKFNFNHAT